MDETRASASLESAIAGWAERDHARAIVPADHTVIDTTAAARALVLELLDAPATGRDLFNACARLGRLMAEGGASPSLTAGAIDNALAAKRSVIDLARVDAARASLVEGYVAATRDAERAAARAAWAYPACVVSVDATTIAVACGHPSTDAETLGEWASDIATRATRAKVRRALLSGSQPACAAVASAFELVGITIVKSVAEASDKPRRFRLPWQK